MKIQCNACEAAEAAVLCCADEAALCWACDERVHAANKLAGKHQRVSLLSDGAGGSGSSTRGVPKCDICQEASGFFFCLEDRALLCRSCDLAIHTANPYVSAHQRFLVTGTILDWPLDDFFGFPDFNQNFCFTEHSASKADSGRHGSSQGSPTCRSTDDDRNADECLGQVPEFWTVPEIPPPPTASGLSWQRNRHYPASNNTFFVPDICSSYDPNSFDASAGSKRRNRQ
ncbi:hypothetical protein C4D60_Mb06t15250 [Musa balbisiana]|uniref:B box-type domain-containing protein n=1 Tax=Musa balbisiana TaxID=52838 RepID=A0A4S8IN65_MUSBA|nr:hypothetical protein C4D60_Mb06t15250 [Musa balbisiana]